MRPALSLSLAVVLVLCGCAYKKRTVAAAPAPARVPAAGAVTSSAPEPVVTPDTGLAGKVASFNNDGRFVVLNFPLGHLPAVEQRLFVYRQELKVGEIKVSGPQRDDLIVADLVAGEAQPGDDVRDK
jgi:hypothetical protein